MCRKHHVEFTVCHHKDYTLDFFFPCANHPCGKTDQVVEQVHTFCLQCLRYQRGLPKDPETEAIMSLQQRSANDGPLHKVRRVFDLAARPGERFRAFDKKMNNFVLTNGMSLPVYDAFNLAEFSGRLTEADEVFLHSLNHAMRAYIREPDTPDMTENQYMLYRQVVAAVLALSITKKETYLREQESKHNAFLRRLNTILRPIRTQALRDEDDPDCPICLEPMGEDGSEEPVRLPCGCLVGRTCLENLIREWAPNEPFLICLPCRDAFDFLTPLELTQGITVTSEDEIRMRIQPPGGWGINLLRAAWEGPE